MHMGLRHSNPGCCRTGPPLKVHGLAGCVVPVRGPTKIVLKKPCHLHVAITVMCRWHADKDVTGHAHTGGHCLVPHGSRTLARPKVTGLRMQQEKCHASAQHSTSHSRRLHSMLKQVCIKIFSRSSYCSDTTLISSGRKQSLSNTAESVILSQLCLVACLPIAPSMCVFSGGSAGVGMV